MSYGLFFWIVVIVGVLCGFFFNRAPNSNNPRMGYFGNDLILLILIIILGLATFGAALHR